jgi:hypothetical protein
MHFILLGEPFVFVQLSDFAGIVVDPVREVGGR